MAKPSVRGPHPPDGLRGLGEAASAWAGPCTWRCAKPWTAGPCCRAAASPTSRDLARELDVSRNTVNHAYEQLQVEGYVRSQVGRGTQVVDTLPAAMLLSGGRAPARRAAAAAPAPGGLSVQAQALLKTAQASEQQWGARC